MFIFLDTDMYFLKKTLRTALLRTANLKITFSFIKNSNNQQNQQNQQNLHNFIINIQPNQQDYHNLINHYMTWAESQALEYEMNLNIVNDSINIHTINEQYHNYIIKSKKLIKNKSIKIKKELSFDIEI